MIFLATFALPLLMIPVVLLAGKKAWVAAAATAGGLAGSGVLAVYAADAAPLLVLGRTVGLTPLTSGAVAVSCALLAVVAVHTIAMPMERLGYVVCLAAMSVLTLGLAVRNATLGGLMLEIGMLIAILLVPLRRRDGSMDGARTMAVVALLLPLILLGAATLGEGSLLAGERTQTGRFAVAGLLMLALGLTPFHVWIVPLFRRGPALATVMLTVVLGTVMLAYSGELLRWPDSPQQTGALSELLLITGIASALLGGLTAFGQRSLERVLACAALADLGVVAIGLGLGRPQELVAAVVEVAFRGVAITAASIALGVFRRRLGGDDEYHLRGALRRAPLCVVGATFALLSLAGLPLTAGFGTRLIIVSSLARQDTALAVAVVAASLGPVWAIGRSMRAAFSPIQYPGEQREPRLSGALVLALGMLLLLWGVCPRWVPFSPVDWLSGWIGGA